MYNSSYEKNIGKEWSLRMCALNKMDLLYFYFTHIVDKEPVLDVGMFLEKCGWISRQFREIDCGYDKTIDAVNVTNDTIPNIYYKLYSDIFKDIKSVPKTYATAFMFGTSNAASSEELDALLWPAMRISDEMFLEQTVFQQLDLKQLQENCNIQEARFGSEAIYRLTKKHVAGEA